MKKFTSLQDLIICMGLKLFNFTIHFNLAWNLAILALKKSQCKVNFTRFHLSAFCHVTTFILFCREQMKICYVLLDLC